MCAGSDGNVIDPAKDEIPLFEFWRPTGDWVRANLFRLLDAGIGASVLREGDDKRGAVLIVLADADGSARVLDHVRSPSGNSQWVPTHDSGCLTKDESDQALRAALARDPDLWIFLIDAESFAAGSGRAHPYRPIDGTSLSSPDAVVVRAAARPSQGYR